MAPPPPPPPLPDELFEEILLRFPPGEPAWLLRASAVCKAWWLAVSHPGFRRRLHELHPAPPLLGFLPYRPRDRAPCFIPATASYFSLHAPDSHAWWALDCRHGRALFLSGCQDPQELLVWEPTTGAHNRLPVPVPPDNVISDVRSNQIAAVLCAADGCDHRDCLGGPFRVVFVSEELTEEEEEEDHQVIWACVYSSETGAWGEPTLLHGDSFMGISKGPSMLVGGSLLYFGACVSILEYDLARHALTVLEPPNGCEYIHVNLMLTDDGRLGVIQNFDSYLKLWTREASEDGTDARWVLSRVIHLLNLFPTSARLNEGFILRVMGFVEGANAILVSSVAGIFIIELQTEQVRKVCDDFGFSNLVPVVTFYTPAPRGDRQNLLMPKPSEQAGDEEGVEGEKKIDPAQQPFDKGSNAINEGDFINTFEWIHHDHNFMNTFEWIRHDHNIREDAPACASTFDKYGCAYKAQEVNGSLDDVPKSAPNEESVKGTTSEDEAGDSKDFWQQR